MRRERDWLGWVVAALLIFAWGTSDLHAELTGGTSSEPVKCIGSSPCVAGKILSAGDLQNALGGGSETATTIFEVTGASTLTIEGHLSHNAATDVAFICEVAVNSTASRGWAPLNSQSISSGVATLSTLQPVKVTGGADLDFVYSFGVPDGMHYARCRFDGAAADGDDDLDVYAHIGAP